MQVPTLLCLFVCKLPAVVLRTQLREALRCVTLRVWDVLYLSVDDWKGLPGMCLRICTPRGPQLSLGMSVRFLCLSLVYMYMRNTYTHTHMCGCLCI